MVAGVLALVGCGITVPADPDGTLDSVRGGELRVGVSADSGLVETHGNGASGSLAELAMEYAASLHAKVRWTAGSEETLVMYLEERKLDLVIGGITDQTPWLDHVGVTRGYAGIEGADGRGIVMLVPPGENAFLSDLERFLDAEVGS
jgi:ABC-type amino acid transport substrate-binding protein